MKKIVIIGTGGTMSMDIDEEGVKRTSYSVEDLIRKIPELRDDPSIVLYDLFSIDSSNMLPSDWMVIARKVYEFSHKYDGIVLIHGTDTMAYTSSAISFMVQNLGIPVIFTGSQKGIGEDGSDVEYNLINAVNIAKSDLSGVYVVFAGRIIRGCRAVKTSAVSIAAFESVNFPYVAPHSLRAYFLPLEFKRFEFDTTYPRRYASNPVLYDNIEDKVFLLKMFPGMDPNTLITIKELGYRGIVLEGFGVGNIPTRGSDGYSFVEKARDLVDSGIPIVVTTECLYEATNLDYYEGGKAAQEAGLIPAYDMTKETTLTKLMWVLGQCQKRYDQIDIRWVRKRMIQNFMGEIRDIHEE